MRIRRSIQHAVQFYEKDDFLLDGVTRFVRRGPDLNVARRRASYIALDAAEKLAKFLEAAARRPASRSR